MVTLALSEAEVDALFDAICDAKSDCRNTISLFTDENGNVLSYAGAGGTRMVKEARARMQKHDELLRKVSAARWDTGRDWPGETENKA